MNDDQRQEEHERLRMVDNENYNHEHDYNEETAAEIDAPVNQPTDMEEEREEVVDGTVLGYIALGISIISLFFLPVLLGTTSIIMGFFARRRGATALGVWAMVIGAVSLVIGLFILPFV